MESSHRVLCTGDEATSLSHTSQEHSIILMLETRHRDSKTFSGKCICPAGVPEAGGSWRSL